MTKPCKLCEDQYPKCYYCEERVLKYYDDWKWLGQYKGNKGSFLLIKCPHCKESFVGWQSNVTWWNTFPREEARDITA